MRALAGSRARTRQLRIGIAALTPLVLVGYLVIHRASVDAGTDALSAADRDWIVLGGCCAALTWLAATGCQLGAIDGSVPVRRLFATQVASSFLSHVLPAGVGQVGLNVRMLRRAGLSAEKVVGAIALNTAAGAVVHTVALLGLLAVVGAPGHLVNGTLLTVLIIAVVVGSAASCALVRLGRGPTRLGTRARTALKHIRAVLNEPRRATLLIGGSAAILLLHITALVAVVHALHQPTSVATVAVIYLACSAVGAALPGPGGFGGFDVLLASAFVGIGMTAGLAAGAVIAYRTLTVWLPMLPSAVTLLVMMRRRIV